MDLNFRVLGKAQRLFGSELLARSWTLGVQVAELGHLCTGGLCVA